MEKTPVNTNLGEAPIKGPDHKEKAKGKKPKTTSFSQKLGIEAVFSNVLAKAGEEKTSRNLFRRKPKAERAPIPTEPDKKEAITSQPVVEPAKKDREPELKAESVIAEADDEVETDRPEDSAQPDKLETAEEPLEATIIEDDPNTPKLPSADEAWDIVNRNKQLDDKAENPKTLKSDEDKEPAETVDINPSFVAEQSPNEEFEVVDVVATAEISEGLVADGKVHELTEVASETYQHLEPESETFVIDHEPNSADFEYEIQEITETSPQIFADINATAESAQAPAVELTPVEAGGNEEPPQPPQFSEQAADSSEPARPTPITESAPTQSFYRERVHEHYRTVPIEAMLADDEPAPVAAEPKAQAIEGREKVDSESWSSDLLGWVEQRRLGRELRHGQRRQKKQIKEFAHQEKQSGEKLQTQLKEQKTLSKRHQSKLSQQIEKVSNLFTRPAHETDTSRTRIRYHVVERERELIRERQKAHLHKPKAQVEPARRDVARVAENPEILVRPVGQWATLDLLPKIEEALYLEDIKESAPIETSGRVKLMQILESAIRPESTGREQADQVIQSRFETTAAPKEKILFKKTTTERPAELKKDKEVISLPVQTVVAETAIEQVLHLPPEHRLQKSVWHNIEVDKSGRAVEQPVFAYGHEFLREQRQEARSYKAPLVAAQTGLLAIADASSAVTMAVNPPLVVNQTVDFNMPAIAIEETLHEPTKRSGDLLEDNLGLLIAVAIILLSIAGLILVH